MTKSEKSPSAQVDKLIAGLTDWRGKRFEEIRAIIHAADPEITEEWKWMGTPVWEHYGMVAIANPHKGKVKLTFVHGASLPDPAKLFNAGLGGNQWRAIDFFEHDKINARALKALVRKAVEYNQAHRKGKATKAPSRTS